MLHLMRQTLADTAAASQDDRPAAGGDVDMVDQGAAAPDPQVPTGVSLSKAQNESLAKMAGERKRQLLAAATRGGQRASDGRTPAAAQPRALAPVPQSGVQPPPAHGARCPGEQEARSLGPASHVEARAPDAHRPRSARLPHSARSSAQCAAHGLARVQTAFSTSRTFIGKPSRECSSLG